MGETLSFHLKSDSNYSTPNVEDLIKEDEYLLKPYVQNQGYKPLTDEEYELGMLKRIRAIQARQHKEFEEILGIKR